MFIRDNNLGFYLHFRLGSDIAGDIIFYRFVLWSDYEVKKEIGMRPYRQTGTDEQTDNLPGTLPDRQTDRPTTNLVGIQADGQTGRQTDNPTE